MGAAEWPVLDESEMAALEAETGESCRSLGIDPAHPFRPSCSLRSGRHVPTADLCSRPSVTYPLQSVPMLTTFNQQRSAALLPPRRAGRSGIDYFRLVLSCPDHLRACFAFFGWKPSSARSQAESV